MAFCRECGKKIGDDVKTCPLCGAATAAAPQKKQTAPQAQAAQKPAQAQAPAAAKQPAVQNSRQPDKAKSANASAQQTPQSKSKIEGVNAEQAREPAYDEQEDIKTNKMMAALSYLLFFLPLVTEPAKTSKFARFHANQGLVFLIFYAVIIIITRILSSVFYTAFAFRLWGLWFFLDLVFWLIFVTMSAFAARNAYKAYRGQWRKLPLIGRITIIK